ncbi:MAG: hypothetical protein ABIA62_07695 [Candidatus Woesearchaeota archaeon]
MASQTLAPPTHAGVGHSFFSPQALFIYLLVLIICWHAILAATVMATSAISFYLTMETKLKINSGFPCFGGWFEESRSDEKPDERDVRPPWVSLFPAPT